MNHYDNLNRWNQHYLGGGNLIIEHRNGLRPIPMSPYPRPMSPYPRPMGQQYLT
jgi:hypothetical protein